MTLPAELTPATATPVDLRDLMAGFPTGVAVITAWGSGGGQPWGMTCTAICPVSLDPPMLLVSLRADSPTLDAVLRQSAFTLNLLHSDAEPLARLFASGDPDRFRRVRWSAGTDAGGPHFDDDAHSVADCQVLRADRLGDHVVVYGAVLRISCTDKAPLLYGRREYASWTGP
jgi:flavin reductase (DIM6/NTAB) family NADH-FMN oxidoreductase RutF